MASAHPDLPPIRGQVIRTHRLHSICAHKGAIAAVNARTAAARFAPHPREGAIPGADGTRSRQRSLNPRSREGAIPLVRPWSRLACVSVRAPVRERSLARHAPKGQQVSIHAPVKERCEDLACAAIAGQVQSTPLKRRRHSVPQYTKPLWPDRAAIVRPAMIFTPVSASLQANPTVPGPSSDGSLISPSSKIGPETCTRSQQLWTTKRPPT